MHYSYVISLLNGLKTSNTPSNSARASLYLSSLIFVDDDDDDDFSSRAFHLRCIQMYCDIRYNLEACIFLSDKVVLFLNH